MCNKYEDLIIFLIICELVIIAFIFIMIGLTIGEMEIKPWIEIAPNKQNEASEQDLEKRRVVYQENTYGAIISHYEESAVIIEAEVTAYNNTEEQTDSTPNIMASGATVYEGAIACPRWISLGTPVEIDGILYICEDRTSEKIDGIFDIFMFSKEEAIAYGKQLKEIKIIIK